MSSRHTNANFRGTAQTLQPMKFNAGRGFGTPEWQPTAVGRAFGVLTCDITVEDALFDYDTYSFFRDPSTAQRRLYKARLYTFQLDTGLPKNVVITVVAEGFTPWITVQRDANSYWAAQDTVRFEVTDDNSGEFIVEVTSKEPRQIGKFTLTTVCEEQDVSNCGVPTAQSITLKVTPLYEDFAFNMSAQGWFYAACLTTATPYLSVLGAEEAYTTTTQYEVLSLWGKWFWLDQGDPVLRVNGSAAEEGLLKYWPMPMIAGTYSLDDPAEEDSISEPGNKCYAYEVDLNADDIYLIKPKPHHLSFANIVNIVDKATSTVLASTVNGLWKVPATATYRFEIHELTGLDTYEDGGFTKADVGCSLDCWVKAGFTVADHTLDSPASLSVASTAEKQSSLTLTTPGWSLRFAAQPGETGSGVIDTAVEDPYTATLYCCHDYDDYYLKQQVKDATLRADEYEDPTNIRVSGADQTAANIIFDAAWVAFAQANAAYLTLPDGPPWSGLVPQFVIALHPWMNYAEETSWALFRVNVDCDDSPLENETGFWWEFVFYYGPHLCSYRISARSPTPAGTYALQPWAEDESLTPLPTTLTITTP